MRNVKKRPHCDGLIYVKYSAAAMTITSAASKPISFRHIHLLLLRLHFCFFFFRRAVIQQILFLFLFVVNFFLCANFGSIRAHSRRGTSADRIRHVQTAVMGFVVVAVVYFIDESIDFHHLGVYRKRAGNSAQP